MEGITDEIPCTIVVGVHHLTSLLFRWDPPQGYKGHKVIFPVKILNGVVSPQRNLNEISVAMRLVSLMSILRSQKLLMLHKIF